MRLLLKILLFTAPLAVAAFAIVSCSSSPGVVLSQGMTKTEVMAKIGGPVRTVNAIDGSGSWLVEVERETMERRTEEPPASPPGESVFRRDERTAAQGISSSVEITTSREADQRWIDFGTDGRLKSEYHDRFLRR